MWAVIEKDRRRASVDPFLSDIFWIAVRISAARLFVNPLLIALVKSHYLSLYVESLLIKNPHKIGLEIITIKTTYQLLELRHWRVVEYFAMLFSVCVTLTEIETLFMEERHFERVQGSDELAILYHHKVRSL